MFLMRTVSLGGQLCRNHSVFTRNFVESNVRGGYVLRQIGIGLRQFSASQQQDQIVYNGSLSNRMKAVKVFSLTTSLTGCAAQPIIYEQAAKIGGTPIIVLMCGFVGFFTFVTPLLLHFITKKYVTNIAYNASTDEYTATTISFFLTKIETKFRPTDVKVPDVPGMFTSFVVGNTPLFVEPTMFTDTEHYVKIMGYDKPIDFKLAPVDENERSTKPRAEKN